MIISVCLVFALFTNRIPAIQVFHSDSSVKTQQPAIGIEDLLNNPSSLTQMQTAVVSQVLDKRLNTMMNLSVTFILMYFIMLLGFRLSSLGVQLIRPINVRLRTSDEKHSVPKPN